MSRRYWGAKHEGRKERLRRWLVFSIHPKNSDTARDLEIRVTTTILTGRIPLCVCGGGKEGVEGEEQGRRGRKITGKRERLCMHGTDWYVITMVSYNCYRNHSA